MKHIDMEHVIQRYKDGDTFDEIAAPLDVNSGTIRYRLIKAGIPIRSSAETVRSKYRNGASITQLRDLTGKTPGCIANYLESKGIAIRTRSEANTLDHQKRRRKVAGNDGRIPDSDPEETEELDTNIKYYLPPTRNAAGEVIKINWFYGRKVKE